jgi:hypothetical protein
MQIYACVKGKREDIQLGYAIKTEEGMYMSMFMYNRVFACVYVYIYAYVHVCMYEIPHVYVYISVDRHCRWLVCQSSSS